MEIREATSADLPAIISLLKLSLGESLLPKSEEYWRWKHIDNPFGTSPVLLATEKDEVIGVRAFMKWKWSGHGREYTAVRAVDTATHPQHQGKGIFKKLTLQLLDQCKKDGIDFVFNTPNEQSRPGYLKMGWETAGRLPLHFHFNRPLSLLSRIALRSKGAAGDPESLRFAVPNELLQKASEMRQEKIQTHKSPAYFKWRYTSIPIAKYGSVESADQHAFLIYRIKSSRRGVELRICDYYAPTNDYYNELVRLLYKTTTEAHFTAVSGVEPSLPGLLSIRMNVGPIVTVRKLNIDNTTELTNFNNWSPSIGDMELF